MVAVHLGACAITVMIATALDHDGPGAGDRRHCDGNRTKGCDDKSKFPHAVLLIWVRMKQAIQSNVPPEPEENS